jgi:SPX domain protein involved in polyphosphate accumulation
LKFYSFLIVAELTGIDTSETLAYRQRALLKFLERVALHPTLRHSKDLQAFLEMEADTFEHMRSQGDKEETLSNVGGFFMGLLKRKASDPPQFVVEKKNLVDKVSQLLQIRLNFKAGRKIKSDEGGIRNFGRAKKRKFSIDSGIRKITL